MSDIGLVPARTEVAWFFASSSAAMGLHAQTYDSGGGGAVWDESRIDRLHRGRLEARHRQNVVRYERVLATMREAGPDVVGVLRRVYVPFGASRVSWQAYCCFTHEDRQLLGLVLAMPELAGAYARQFEGKVADRATLLQFVTDEVSHLDHTMIRPGHALPVGHVLEPALRAATRREAEAIGSYEVLRAARVHGEMDAQEQYYVDLRKRI